MVAFRQSTGVTEVVWKTKKAYKFWRYVLVDHSGQQVWFSGIGWFVKTKDYLKMSMQQAVENGGNEDSPNISDASA